MKETILSIFSSFYTWIAIELIIIAVLVFFVVRYSRRKKAKISEISRQKETSRYSELDDMLVNRKKRSEK